MTFNTKATRPSLDPPEETRGYIPTRTALCDDARANPAYADPPAEVARSRNYRIGPHIEPLIEDIISMSVSRGD